MKLTLNELRSVIKEVIDEAEFTRLTQAMKGTAPEYKAPHRWPEQGQQQQPAQDREAATAAHLLRNTILRGISRPERDNIAKSIMKLIPAFAKTNQQAVEKAYQALIDRDK